MPSKLRFLTPSFIPASPPIKGSTFPSAPSSLRTNDITMASALLLLLLSLLLLSLLLPLALLLLCVLLWISLLSKGKNLCWFGMEMRTKDSMVLLEKSSTPDEVEEEEEEEEEE